MKYLLLTVALIVTYACNDGAGADPPDGQEHYDPSRPPLTKGQFPYVQSVYCGRSREGGQLVNIWVFDSAGTPLSQFAIKTLKKPYSILSNVAFFSTDQNGQVKVSYKDCDSLELANLSQLAGKPCRIGVGNLPDTILITLAVSEEKFIETNR